MDGAADAGGNTKSDEVRRAARRRARLAAIFGDDLPEQTRDESGEGHKGHPQEWFEAQRPPHHG